MAAVAEVVAPVDMAKNDAQVTLEGYALTPNTKWTTGNLGKDYREGEWVPYRFIVQNTSGVLGSFGPHIFRHMLAQIVDRHIHQHRRVEGAAAARGV